MPKHLWTPDEARANALKGAEAWKAKALTIKQAKADNGKHQGQPIDEDSPDSFSNTRLMRIRKQLCLLDTAIEAELSEKAPDGQRVDRLAAASMRLNDQEFALANRPKPKPGSVRIARRPRSGHVPPPA